MKTLVIYDENGNIYFNSSGDIKIPNDINFLVTEEYIPNNKIISKVDVANNRIIYQNQDTIGMSIDEIKTYYINKAEQNKADYLKNNPIIFIHNEIESQYPIDENSQNLLTKEIMMYTFAKDSGQDYTLVWRDINGECNSEWDINDLKQLAYEINLIESRLANKLQEIKTEIMSCTNEDEIEKIDITF